MKKVIIAAATIIAMTVMSMTVNGYDYDNIPIGDTLSPTISSNSLEDFSEKLNELAPESIQALFNDVSIDEIYDLVIEEIESGESYLYLPDIDCEITEIKMYVMSDQSNIPYASSKYGMTIHKGDKVGLDTQCSFRYGDMVFRIGCEIHAFESGNMLLHDKEISYWLRGDATVIYFSLGEVDLGITIYKAMTADEIKSLPEGMFAPKEISIADVRSGSCFNDADIIVIEEPKEADVVKTE